MGIRIDLGRRRGGNVVSNAAFGPTDSYGIRPQSSPRATAGNRGELKRILHLRRSGVTMD
jgi:hypothetical protein